MKRRRRPRGVFTLAQRRQLVDQFVKQVQEVAAARALQIMADMRRRLIRVRL